MGDALSVPIDDEQPRSPLKSIENVESFRMGVASKTPEMRASTRRPSRKRSRLHPIPRSFTPPAGCATEVGPIGTRWPIQGIAAEILAAQGHLEVEDRVSSEDVSALHWLLETESYVTSYSPLPRLISSSSFRFHPIGTRLLWRLTIAPKDHRNDAISVYLESVNGQLGEPFLIDAHFTLSIAAGGATLCVQALHHGFSSRDPVVGIHNVTTFTELLNNRTTPHPRLTIGLRFCWVRDTRLFPPRFITLCDKQPELYKISASPKIFMVEHFLTTDECEELIQIATPLLYRSRVSSGTETPSRTSSSMFFTGSLSRTPVVKTVEEKLLRLIERPEIHEGRQLKPNESLQAVRYHIGEFYAEHYDVRQGQSHMRAATLIVYLQDTEAGGATYFPLASPELPGAEQLYYAPFKKQNDRRRGGLRIFPRRGRAVFFWSRTEEGKEDKTSLHAAEPIIMGEKWIATRWLRELDPL